MKLVDGEVNCKKMKRQQEEKKDKYWEQKKMCRQLRMLLKEDFVDKEESFKWIKKKPSTPQTHSQITITAIQDQAIKITRREY